MPYSPYELAQPKSSGVKLRAWISKYPDRYPCVVVSSEGYREYRHVEAPRELRSIITHRFWEENFILIKDAGCSCGSFAFSLLKCI